jgi:hypothetical protein
VDNKPIRILLQTTIVPDANDWSIARFGRLAALLGAQRNAGGMPLFDVVSRDRATAEGPDPVLSTIDTSDFDQLWLFAVDTGTGLDAEDCASIGRFRGNGKGLLVTRDHMDLGSSVCSLGGVGAAHFFHTRHPDPDAARHVIDDPYTTYISWPNYHSGANGDYQEIEAIGPVHPVLADAGSPTGAIRYLPAHPHEGGIGAPVDEQARVIARGRSIVTGARFNIAVAFEPYDGAGPAIAQSTFHHFADYNWDPKSGCPSFVDEPAGSGMAENPDAMRDTERYVLNVAGWLGAAGRTGIA